MLMLGAVSGSSCACGTKATLDAGQGLHDASVPDAGADGSVDAGIEPTFDAGASPDSGAPVVLKITRLLPPRAPSAGGVFVLIEGSGFLRDFARSSSQAMPLTTLKFGSNPVIDFQVIDDETIEARSPPGIAGQASVSLVNPNGRFVCSACLTYYDELVVTGFSPKVGPLSGGNEALIDGQGFTRDVQVLFGARASPVITLASATQLKVTVPRGATADLVDLRVYNKNGASTQRRSYRYVGAPRVAAVTPLTGPLTGGTTVTLTGSGFTDATEVKFGGVAGTELLVRSDRELTVVAPPATAAGAVSVTITTPHGHQSVRDGFTYFASDGSLAVFGVFPHVVKPGDTVTVTGQALASVLSLTATIGGVNALVGLRTESTVSLTVPDRGAAPRRSDLVLTLDENDSPLVLPAAVTWRVEPTALNPSTGPAAEATTITVTGTALPPDAQVFLGALPAMGTTVSSEERLTAVTPAGSGGAPSDLMIREAADLENEAWLPQAFTFLEPLSIGRVQPERGAIAGNTLVTVSGAGFGESTVVVFGGNRAKDVKLVDSHTLTCRTPVGTVGTVDVRVERLTQRDTFAGGFSYFDPRSASGGSSGGPLVGTLNVTVLDSTRNNYGAPVALANVQLGIDPATPFQGTTDARGQITFSDPSLVKAQTVTVFKDLYESVTVAQVASENLTVFIARTGGGASSSSPSTQSTPASTIAGRVTGFKAPRPLSADETLEARVFVAQTSLFGGTPFSGGSSRGGETWRLAKDGSSYLVATNGGLHAVYAVLGIVEGTTMRFTPLTMGVRRGVTTSPDVPATGEDIVLDMQLDLTVPIVIDSPLTMPDEMGNEAPAVNALYAWLDLGAEGFIPNPNNWSAGTSDGSSVLSTDTTLNFPNFAQLDGSNFVFLAQASSVTNSPVSYSFRRQPGPMNGGVTIGPLLPAPRLAPLTGFEGTLSWSMPVGIVPDLFNLEILRPSALGATVVWSVILPGTATGVVLPPSAVTKLKTEEAGRSLFVVLYGSRSPKFSYPQWTYGSLSGANWSSFTLTVSDSFVMP